MEPESRPGRLVGAEREGGMKAPKPDTMLGAGSLAPTPMEQDNWKHRSKHMLCGTCIAFVPKATGAIQRGDHLIGRCRYHAPTMKGWPVMFSDDWCWDHKLDEEKI